MCDTIQPMLRFSKQCDKHAPVVGTAFPPADYKADARTCDHQFARYLMAI